jgi:hypothetical protein
VFTCPSRGSPSLLLALLLALLQAMVVLVQAQVVVLC